jgi:hypothetical protein
MYARAQTHARTHARTHCAGVACASVQACLNAACAHRYLPILGRVWGSRRAASGTSSSSSLSCVAPPPCLRTSCSICLSVAAHSPSCSCGGYNDGVHALCMPYWISIYVCCRRRIAFIQQRKLAGHRENGLGWSVIQTAHKNRAQESRSRSGGGDCRGD